MNDSPPTGRFNAGKLAVIGTLSLFVIVPAITIASFRIMQANFEPTDQMQRELQSQDGRPAFLGKLDTWSKTAMSLRDTTLRRGPMSSARANKIFKDLPFDVSPEEEELVRATARIAQKPYLEQREPTDADRQALRDVMDERGAHFYPLFVLAMWEQTPEASMKARSALDQATTPDVVFIDHYEDSYASSPAVVLDQTLRPMARSYPPQVHIEPIAFVFDRVRDDVVDTTLILWFPKAPRFQLFPLAYPVYKSIFRLRNASIPVDQADSIDPEHPPKWLVFPGDVGSLDLNEL